MTAAGVRAAARPRGLSCDQRRKPGRGDIQSDGWGDVWETRDDGENLRRLKGCVR